MQCVKSVKERIKKECQKQGKPITKVLMDSHIPTCDYYQAVNGKRPFFPAWRKRLASTLNIPENELFPEYVQKEG